MFQFLRWYPHQHALALANLLPAFSTVRVVGVAATADERLHLFQRKAD